LKANWYEFIIRLFILALLHKNCYEVIYQKQGSGIKELTNTSQYGKEKK